MLNKITNLPMIAYLAISGFFHELKDDERGLSGVVVTVLLILIAVIAVFLVWGWLSGWLQGLFTQIEEAVDL